MRQPKITRDNQRDLSEKTAFFYIEILHNYNDQSACVVFGYQKITRDNQRDLSEKTAFFYIEILHNYNDQSACVVFWVPKDNKGHSCAQIS
jgi:hypothetical protein